MSKLGNKNYSHISQIVLDVVYCWQSFAVEKLFELKSFYYTDNIECINVYNNSKNIYSIKFTKEKEEFIINIFKKENIYDDFSQRNLFLNCNLKDLHINLNEIDYKYFIKIANDFNEEIKRLNEDKINCLNILNDLKNFNKNQRYVNELLIELKK
jgi:hypothetical protein